MKFSKWAMTALLAAATLIPAEAKVLRDIDFHCGNIAADGLRFDRFGDGKAEGGIVNDAQLGGIRKKPFFLFAPTQRSWGYLIIDIPAKEIPAGGRLQLTVWGKSNLPGRLGLFLCEGVTVGAWCKKYARTRAEKAYERHSFSVELPRKAPEDLISAAVGFDYYSAGAWAVIDRIVVEHLADGEKSAVAEEKTADYQRLAVPTAWLQKCFSFDLGKMLNMQGVQYKRYEKAGLANNAAVQKQMELAKKLYALYSGKLDLGLLPQIEGGLLDSALNWQTVEDMALFSKDTVLPPVSTQKLDVVAPIYGRAGATLLIDNGFYEPVNYRISVKGDAAPFVKLSRLHWVDGVPDCPIPVGNEEILELGSGAPAGFMVDFSAKGLKTGTYKGELILSPLDSRLPERKIAYDFKVIGYRLPDVLPIRTFMFDFNSAANPEMMALLRETRINTFHVTLHDRNDFKNLHRMIDEIDKNGIRDTSMLYIEVWFVRYAKEWKPEFNAWLDRLVKELESRNWGYDRWILHIYDEVLNEEFYQSAKAIKAHNPNVRIFSDCIAKDEATVKKFSGVVDVWCPHMRSQTEQRAMFSEATKAMRATGLPVMVYDCDSTATYPLDRYRVMPYLTWLDGDQGAVFWSTISGKLRNPQGQDNWGMSYKVNGKIIPSRRWRMWAAGLEDYLLLVRAAELKPAETRKLAEAVFAAFGKPEFAAVTEKTRRNLLEIIAGADK